MNSEELDALLGNEKKMNNLALRTLLRFNVEDDDEAFLIDEALKVIGSVNREQLASGEMFAEFIEFMKTHKDGEVKKGPAWMYSFVADVAEDLYDRTDFIGALCVVILACAHLKTNDSKFFHTVATVRKLHRYLKKYKKVETPATNLEAEAILKDRKDEATASEILQKMRQLLDL